MGETTAIAWTDHTFNPWVGCARVSPGCQHCYAEALTKRTGLAVWGQNGTRHVTSDAYWRDPLKWDRAAEAAGRPALVFCASLADVFEDRADVERSRQRLFELIEATPHLIWQLLTKRPENVLEMVPPDWYGCGFADHPERLWPRNVWIGTTVEDQQRADERVPRLLEIPAAVRFLSCEPLLGPVDLRTVHRLSLGALQWVIVGGESGPGRRVLDLSDARGIVEQCVAADVPVFFKQDSGPRPGWKGPADLERYKQFPISASSGTRPGSRAVEPAGGASPHVPPADDLTT